MQIEQAVNHMCGQIIGSGRGEAAAVAADGRAAVGAEKDVCHR
jgi:hypothetical protein